MLSFIVEYSHPRLSLPSIPLRSQFPNRKRSHMSNIANIITNGIAQPLYEVDPLTGAPRVNADGIVLLASSTITANGNTDIQVNNIARGIKLYISPGSFGSGASAITVKVQGYDPVSKNFFDMLTSASLTANTPVALTIYPGITATANISVNDVLPRSWRVTWQATAYGTGGSTLGITAAVLL
jgi:hypothetical protein